MSTVSRWLTWTPKGTLAGPIIEKTPEPKPPKTPKPSFEGFAGATPGLVQKIGAPELTGRIAAFPHCPRCCSYYLYRQDNIGAYECQTCGLSGIEESTARRMM